MAPVFADDVSEIKSLVASVLCESEGVLEAQSQ